MNKSLEKIRDIKSLINEVYDDRKCQGELNENTRKSWLCFKQYCDDIKQDLERLQQLEKENQELKEKYRRSFGSFLIMRNECHKLQTAIEILKEKIHLELFEPKDEKEMKKCLEANEEPYLIIIGEEWFTLNDKNKFDLLKEVLE